MEFLKKVRVFLQGKKTKVLALLMAAYTLAKAFGLDTTPEQDKAIYGLLVALLSLTFDAKINRQYR